MTRNQYIVFYAGLVWWLAWTNAYGREIFSKPEGYAVICLLPVALLWWRFKVFQALRDWRLIQPVRALREWWQRGNV